MTIFLSDESANLYFPEGNATGQTMELIVADGQHVQVTVGGVFERFPVNSTIKFSFLMPYANLQSWFGSDPNDWDGWTRATFIALKEGASIDAVRAKIDPYLKLQNEANPTWAVDEYYLDPFAEASFNASYQRSSFLIGENPAGVLVMVLIGIILLVLASFNFANNSLVLVSRRFREIGIRKISGSTRGQMIVQFIGENLLFMVVAVCLAIAASEVFLFPMFNSLFPQAGLNLSMLMNSHGILFLASVLLIAGIGTGLYPAMVVSRYKPVDIFRGAKSSAGYGLAVRILTGVQIALTFGLLFFTAYLQVNHVYQRNIDWGYNPTNVLWTRVEDPAACEVMLSQLADNPYFEEIYSVQDHVSAGWRLQALVIDEVRHDIAGLGVVPGYMEMMGYRLLDGKFFDPVSNENSSSTEAVINDVLAKELGLDQTLGTNVTLDGEPFTIVGIVESTVNNGLTSERHPAMYTFAPKDRRTRIVTRAIPGHMTEAAKALSDAKRAVLPDQKNEVQYQDESFAGIYRMFHRISSLLNFCALMALLISLMGLFGLISSQLSNRERELAVRRVLGAHLREVISLVTWPFVRLFLISTVVIIAPTWYLTLMYAKGNYSELAPLSLLIPIVTGGVMLALIVGTLLSQITLVTRRNPSAVLRDE